MSTYSNPFERFEEMFERMASQFEETARSFDEESRYALPGMGKKMAVDLVEHDDEYVATVDLPGFERDDVEVRVTDNTLHVEATHEEATEDREETYLRKERSHRSMERSIRLPEHVDADETEASFKNGVLTVTVPKAEPMSSARRIEIE